MADTTRIDVMSMVARRRLDEADQRSITAMRRLATGLRIVSSGDDAAGLVASETLRSELATLDAQSRAAERSDAFLNVADGALREVRGLLSEAESLAGAGEAGFLSDEERAANEMQVNSLVQAADRVVATTTFAGEKVLDNATISAGGVSVSTGAPTADDLGLTRAAEGTPSADDIRAAARSVGDILGRIGSFQRNVLAPEKRRLSEATINTAGALSSIRDADYAMETAAVARESTIRRGALGALKGANSDYERVARLLAA